MTIVIMANGFTQVVKCFANYKWIMIWYFIQKLYFQIELFAHRFEINHQPISSHHFCGGDCLFLADLSHLSWGLFGDSGEKNREKQCCMGNKAALWFQ